MSTQTEVKDKYKITTCEVWILRVLETGDCLKAIDVAGNPYLAFASRDDAELGSAAQLEMYGIETNPVRIA